MRKSPLRSKQLRAQKTLRCARLTRLTRLSLSRVILTGLLATALLPALLAQGCTPEPPNQPTEAALAPPEVSGMRPAASYDEIYNRVLEGLDKGFEHEMAASAAAAEAKAAYDVAVETQQNPNPLDAYGAEAREALKASLAQGDGIYAINPEMLTVEEGIPSSISPIARSDDGTLYAVSFGLLRVYSLAGEDSATIASISLDGFEGGKGDVRSVSLAGTTLAIQFQIKERTGDRSSSDYLLAAYAGARTTVLFFDVSEPAAPSYIKTLGLGGEYVSSEVRGGKLYLVTNQMTTPASIVAGWNLAGDEDGDSATKLASIESSLKLRQNDPASFVPSFNDDGNLTALAPEQVYLPSDSYFSSATVFACFDIDSRRCLSVFAAYNPRFAEKVDTVWGEKDLYLLWRVARFDEQSERQTFSTEVARVALDGAAGSGIATWTTLSDTRLHSPFLEERDGFLVGAVEEVATDYRRNWSFVALDRELGVVGRLGVVDGSGAGRLGSFAMIGDKAYAAVAGVEDGLVVLDIGNPTAPEMFGYGPLDGWPQKLAETSGTASGGGGSSATATTAATSTSGLFVGYGSEVSRELQTMAGVDSNITPPGRDQLVLLNTIDTRASGKPIPGEPQSIPELAGTENWRSVWGYDIHVFGDLDLVGVPLFTPGEKNPDIMLRTHYLLYTVDSEGKVAPEALIDLLTGQSLSLQAPEALKGLFAEDGYSTVVPTYDDTSIYLLCAPSSTSSLLPTELIVIDRSTLKVIKILAI